MQQIQYNLLFRWFIGLSVDDSVWVPTVFTKNRERLIAHDAVIELFNEVLAIANKNEWLSGEHFPVNGTLIQAWAGHKSFARTDDSDDDTSNFKGDKRSNDTHESRGCIHHIASSQGYAISQQRRKLIEQRFGWAKLIGPIRQVDGARLGESRPVIRADDDGL
jgi:hypothetical protein